MKILVTGGTGFVGSHLVDRLLDDPRVEVYALVRNPGKARRFAASDRFHPLRGGLSDIPDLPPGLSVVYHLAGLTKTAKSGEYYTVNVAGTASLFRALGAGPGSPRVVHLSSLAAAGPSCPGVPRREEDPPDPVSPYGRSKLAAEREALGHKDRFPLIILRVGAVYGPGDEDFLDYFRWVRRGLIPVFGRRPKILSLCYVSDVVRAVLRAGQIGTVPSGEVFNVADPSPASWEEVGRTAAAILGARARRLRIPHWAAFLAAAASQGFCRLAGKSSALNLSKYRDMCPDEWVADVSKARDILGFETVYPLREGIEATLAWYARQGKL